MFAVATFFAFEHKCEHAGGGSGAARRHRERRLCSWAKHERLSVAVGLAEKPHHSANRTVLPKEEEVEQHNALQGTEASQGRVGAI